jgi:hypothetical protein
VVAAITTEPIDDPPRQNPLSDVDEFGCCATRVRTSAQRDAGRRRWPLMVDGTWADRTPPIYAEIRRPPVAKTATHRALAPLAKSVVAGAPLLEPSFAPVLASLTVQAIPAASDDTRHRRMRRRGPTHAGIQIASVLRKRVLTVSERHGTNVHFTLQSWTIR